MVQLTPKSWCKWAFPHLANKLLVALCLMISVYWVSTKRGCWACQECSPGWLYEHTAFSVQPFWPRPLFGVVISANDSFWCNNRSVQTMTVASKDINNISLLNWHPGMFHVSNSLSNIKKSMSRWDICILCIRIKIRRFLIKYWMNYVAVACLFSTKLHINHNIMCACKTPFPHNKNMWLCLQSAT